MKNNDRVKALRAEISACTRCADIKGVCHGPRYGLGGLNVDRVPLMIVGQNPPQDALRNQHGAWMLHQGCEEPHEKLVSNLVNMIGLDAKTVYAVNVVKCATTGNIPPSRTLVNNCWSYFSEEVNLANPKVLIAFGEVAQCETITKLCPREWFIKLAQDYQVTPIGNSVHKHVWRRGNVIGAPHPSIVGRFCERGSWLEQITKAYRDAYAFDVDNTK